MNYPRTLYNIEQWNYLPFLLQIISSRRVNKNNNNHPQVCSSFIFLESSLIFSLYIEIFHPSAIIKDFNCFLIKTILFVLNASSSRSKFPSLLLITSKKKKTKTTRQIYYSPTTSLLTYNPTDRHGRKPDIEKCYQSTFGSLRIIQTRDLIFLIFPISLSIHVHCAKLCSSQHDLVLWMK